MALTNRQRQFIEHYLATWNASEAARRAGFTGEPATIGGRLLRKVEVQEAIEKRMEENAMKANEVLHRIADVARVNMGDFVTVHDKTKEVPIDDDDPDAGTQLVHYQEFEINWDAVKNRGHLVKKLTMTRAGPVI
jgi:phage terminase small subunit